MNNPTAAQMANKVPLVTAAFWIIKVLCTTVGETFADFLNVQLGFGLGGTSLVMGAVLLAVLIIQFRLRRYVPAIYWLAVVLLSVVGTLLTDNLTDVTGIPLAASSAVFAVLLAVTFVVWYATERTLSIHAITTSRRELFYWLAVLFTFALGTAFGDFLAEALDIGYFGSLLVFAGAIAVVGGLYRMRVLAAIPAFWAAYILTRPLGASMGDLLSQPTDAGGFGWGTTLTSALFLVVIVVLVVREQRAARPAAG